MIRFTGEHFGFDVDTSNKTVKIQRLISNEAGESWEYAHFELPYPVPSEFVDSADLRKGSHIWNQAWGDLESNNPKAVGMLKALLVRPPEGAR